MRSINVNDHVNAGTAWKDSPREGQEQPPRSMRSFCVGGITGAEPFEPFRPQSFPHS
ncbi:hypothetical protein Rleg_0948 [Rhizobium leguminosarum bv. trifolii WSM1325]|uniref:Uncharacterized protein n=1 Tax=Rhizobium leguminosarum bv. trifolii (strain WSM1325) TaxID=395491 RepID=C6AS69_RHILS|nr:hypothetical protein Rleg_0948 [Rhizobium leguminosarum bv. trifolii WSM1325]